MQNTYMLSRDTNVMKKENSNSSKESRVMLSGSKKPPGSHRLTVIGPVDPNERIQVTIRLRRLKEIPTDLLNQTSFKYSQVSKARRIGEKIWCVRGGYKLRSNRLRMSTVSPW